MPGNRRVFTWTELNNLTDSDLRRIRLEYLEILRNRKHLQELFGVIPAESPVVIARRTPRF